ncbi:hypothetical protein D3C80_1559920 [compost metagenome]
MLDLQLMGTADLLLQEINSKLISIILIGTQVNNIGSMNDNLFNAVRFHCQLAFSRIHCFNRLAARILRRSRIYHERTGTILICFIGCAKETLVRAGHM